MSTTTDLEHPRLDDDGLLAIEAHPLALRWMHWINFPVIAVMVWSGLRIYWAYDEHVLAIGGHELFAFFPDAFNEALGLERRLARGIAFHLTFGWFFVLNGIAYVAYLAWSGSWRRIVPDRYDVADAGRVVAHDLHLRRAQPVQGTYNAAQKLAYSTVVVMGAVLVLSGFAIYRPASLTPLTVALGGYETARLIHFWTTILMSLFFVVHVVQVARSGFGNLWSMVSGFEYRALDDDEELGR